MKKGKIYRIPLLCGIIALLIGAFFFGRVCSVKNAIYKNYKKSLSDSTIQEVFMNSNDEETVRKAFNSAVVESSAEVATDVLSEDAAAPAEDGGALEEAAEGAENAAADASDGAAEAVSESSSEAEGDASAPENTGKDAYDTIFPKGMSGVGSLRTAVRLNSIFFIIGAILCLIGIALLIRSKNLDFASIMRSKITWAAIAEILILIVCLIVRPDFFNISYQPSTGMLYGNLIDIVNRSSEITIIAMGMTLVLALGGTDLSVGALVAVSGAFALKLLRWDVTIYNTPGNYTVYPFPLVIAAPLLTCIAMGCFNGFLVGQLGLQPIIATLILMVSGRGVAQILTNGKQFTTLYAPYRFIGQGSFLFLPTPIIITIIVVTAMMIFVRKTAFGTFVESVGINRSASRLSGINAKRIIMIVFAITGFLSGIAGLIYSSRIMSCDSNNAGINYETDAILAAVIGGTNMAGGKFSLAGTIIGSLIIRTIVTFVYYFGISAEATMAFKALIIAVVIVLQSEPVRNAMAKRSQAKKAAKGGAAS